MLPNECIDLSLEPPVDQSILTFILPTISPVVSSIAPVRQLRMSFLLKVSGFVAFSDVSILMQKLQVLWSHRIQGAYCSLKLTPMHMNELYIVNKFIKNWIVSSYRSICLIFFSICFIQLHLLAVNLSDSVYFLLGSKSTAVSWQLHCWSLSVSLLILCANNISCFPSMNRCLCKS